MKGSIYGVHPSVEQWAGRPGMPAEFASPAAYLAAADRYVDDMFAGSKASLRPIYDALLKTGLSVGKDTKACPCKTIVPIYRRHVIAQIKPLKKGRITHRIEITSIDDIDDELKRWLKRAYEMDA
jgi:hypothetical protein